MKSEMNRVWLLVVIAVLSTCGCQPQPDPMLDMLDSQLTTLKIDDLTRTMDFVFSETRFEQKQFEQKVSSGLNRWLSVEAETMDPSKWSLDSFAKPLNDQYSDLPVVQQVPDLNYINTDGYFVQQNQWCDCLAKRLVASKHLGGFELYRLAADNYKPTGDEKDALASVMAKLHPNLSPESATQLANSLKVFDWVIRNVQLEADLELTADEKSAARLDDDAATESAAGIPGTGYKRYPWQVLLYSRGDYVERAKVFMLMMRQLGVENVMLATRMTADDGTVTNVPWCPAVIIDGKYYLFDTKLGLPIPAGKPGTIATLSDVKSNPELLKWLDLDVSESLKDNTKYWVQPDAINELAALVYASPEGLSLRVQQLESRLTGEKRISLSEYPAQLSESMPKIEGLEPAVWDIAYQTHAFRQAVREAVKTASFADTIREKLTWHYMEEAYINDFTLYRTARAKYFNGNFETVKGDAIANAIELFYIMMYEDGTIDQLGSDTDLQRLLGLNADNIDFNTFKTHVESVQSQMRLVRRDSGFFLSQCHFDNGNFTTSANWLGRLRIKPDVERWIEGVDYLSGRCNEARREYAKAIESYGDQDKTQFHGNLIRARILKDLVDQE